MLANTDCSYGVVVSAIALPLIGEWSRDIGAETGEHKTVDTAQGLLVSNSLTPVGERNSAIIALTGILRVTNTHGS